jgi:hypothetical protein
MSDSAMEAANAVGQAARAVGDGVCCAVKQANAMAAQAGDTVADLRGLIRRQPITVAVAMLVGGYLLHKITHPRSL